MKKNIIPIILCVVCIALSAWFILSGIQALDARKARVQEQKNNAAALSKLQQEKAQLKVEDTRDEVAAIEQECAEIQQSIETAESESVQLDEDAAALQEEYEKLLEDETNIYYMTILEALQEGMSKVEEYLENP